MKVSTKNMKLTIQTNILKTKAVYTTKSKKRASNLTGLMRYWCIHQSGLRATMKDAQYYMMYTVKYNKEEFIVEPRTVSM